MARRTGIPAIMAVGKELCRLVNKFGPLIRSLYPENAALDTALTAAYVACEALHEKLMEVAEEGV